jgi:flagellar biosynthesis protein FlhG
LKPLETKPRLKSMARIIPIASGKGGVGKSTLVANLGIALGKAGKTVLLVDLDLGGSNLHTCLGVNNPKLGLSQFIYREVEEAEDLIVETPYPKVYLIAGDGLIPGTANIPFFIKRKLIKQLNNMVADFVLLDLGAGTTNNTLDFFLMSPTAMFSDDSRKPQPSSTPIASSSPPFTGLSLAAIKAKSPQRELIQAFMTEKSSKAQATISGTLWIKMAQIRPKDAEKIVDTLDRIPPSSRD